MERPARIRRARPRRGGRPGVSCLSWVSWSCTSLRARLGCPSWACFRPGPGYSGYLAFLGVAYATYFTGTTGQTLGKMIFDLRVVDTAGQPPGYLRAMLRAALGALSVAAVGLGVLPMAFDPARRALHDRAFRTRVIRG